MCEQTLLHGFPDYNPKSFDPNKWDLWQPLPVHFVGSPDSEHYQELKNIVDNNLDTIVDTLCNTNEFLMMPVEELNAFEKNNPHPDGKLWCSSEQAIGNHYGDAQNVTTNLDILRKFNRLDFELPFHS
jgi:hypothetical protein